ESRLIERARDAELEKDVRVLPPVPHDPDDHVCVIYAAVQTIHPRSARRGGLLQRHGLEVEVLHRLLDLGNIGLRRGDEDALFPGLVRDGHFLVLPRSLASFLFYAIRRTLSPASRPSRLR